MPDNTLNVQESLQNTVQSSLNTGSPGAVGGLSMMILMAKAGDIIAPWWSKTRELQLRRFVKSSDHLSGAVYNMVAKMTSIPIRVEARDQSIKTHVAQAQRFTDILMNASQFGEGWEAFYGKYVEDLFTQDNGAFAEIIGPGPKDGPLTGAPISLAHLDSARCTRTGDPEFPVVYDSLDGRRYKLHYTRVMFNSQMPSPVLEMNGVGFCAVSRAINVTQNLIDIAVYKQEKLGSRPARQIIITGGGLDPEDIQLASQLADRQNSNQGYSRFAKSILAGNRNITDPKIEVINMSELPDGFDEHESTILGMAVIAMAFGMDARELFPAMQAGATKADAIVQHMKQRGKGPGQTISYTETNLNTKFLPPYLKATFDYQDDAQDRQVAEIQNIRAQARQRDLLGKVTDTRIVRENMQTNGEITPEQFEYLELQDGRLPDGLSVEVLFHSPDADYKRWLTGANETNYKEKMDTIMEEIMVSKDSELIKKGRRALAAINTVYKKPAEQMQQQQMQFEQQLAIKRPNAPMSAKPGAGNSDTKPDQSYQQEKFGRKLGVDETTVNDNQANP